MKLFLLAAACLTLVCIAEAAQDFTRFKSQYNKEYQNDAVERYRKKVYKENERRVKEHNERYERGEVTFKMALNHLADMHPREFMATFLGFNRSLRATNKVPVGTPYRPSRGTVLKKEVDWRQKGAVSPVKNQGRCGSCWAFSSTGALESHNFLKNGRQISLSEQNLIDCSLNYGNNGCEGGLMEQAFQYVKDNEGIDTEEAYPYEGEDICEDPKLFVNNTSRQCHLVRPGEFSCNWMVSACAILGGVSELRNKVIPDYWEQEWGLKYCGIFHFRIWRFGTWNDIVIDDFLPTVNNCLLTTQSCTENEFWMALIEKAYVKLHGSYEALRERELSDALVDFTGGVSEVIDFSVERYNEIEDKRSQLFDILLKEANDHSIICFTLSAENGNELGSRSELGLVRGHTYHLTDIRKTYLAETNLKNLFNGREKFAMIRLRDPRGEEKKPPGSPDSAVSEAGSYAFTTEALSRLRSRNKEWNKVNDNERQQLGLSFRDSSEFWMPLDDVVWGFSDCTIVRLVSENPFALPGQKWKGSSMHGQWETGSASGMFDRSGGGDTRQDSFLRNPQYLMVISKELELLLQLLQFRDPDGADTPHGHINLLIGFHVIRVEENRKTRLHKIWPHTPIVIAEDHRRKREVTFRGWIYPGRYVIIPTTYRSGDTLSFILRAFSKKDQVQIRELKLESPKNFNLCSCVFPEIQWVTVIIVDSAEITTKSFSKINPYCSIQSEGEKTKTDTAKDDWNPVWNMSYIFYRKKPHKSVVLKVWTHNTLFPDALIGECELPAGVTHIPTPLDAVLLHKISKDSEPEQVGTIHLTVLTEDNVMAL